MGTGALTLDVELEGSARAHGIPCVPWTAAAQAHDPKPQPQS